MFRIEPVRLRAPSILFAEKSVDDFDDLPGAIIAQAVAIRFAFASWGDQLFDLGRKKEYAYELQSLISGSVERFRFTDFCFRHVCA